VPGRASGIKMVGWQKWGHQLVWMGWQSIWVVGASACVIFIGHQKIQKMAKCTFWYQLTRVVPDEVQRAVKGLSVIWYIPICYMCLSLCGYRRLWTTYWDAEEDNRGRTPASAAGACSEAGRISAEGETSLDVNHINDSSNNLSSI